MGPTGPTGPGATPPPAPYGGNPPVRGYEVQQLDPNSFPNQQQNPQNPQPVKAQEIKKEDFGKNPDEIEKNPQFKELRESVPYLRWKSDYEGKGNKDKVINKFFEDYNNLVKIQNNGRDSLSKEDKGKQTMLDSDLSRAIAASEAQGKDPFSDEKIYELVKEMPIFSQIKSAIFGHEETHKDLVKEYKQMVIQVASGRLPPPSPKSGGQLMPPINSSWNLQQGQPVTPQQPAGLNGLPTGGFTAIG